VSNGGVAKTEGHSEVLLAIGRLREATGYGQSIDRLIDQ
jgi:hypothetical protein